MKFFKGAVWGQDDAIFAYRDSAFVNISSEVNLPKKEDNITTIGMVSADFENNGSTDILFRS